MLQISIIPHSAKTAFMDRNNNLHEIPTLRFSLPLPERQDFHNRIQASAQFADKKLQ
jgi:hypothetical protein